MRDDKELTDGTFRLAGGDVAHGWWYLPHQWGIGVELWHEPKAPCWAPKWGISFQVGPLSWGIFWEDDR